jgi:hypothetical protein
LVAREPKSRTKTIVEIVGRPGGLKGRLEITSGNFVYFQPNSQVETLRLTHQQMIALLDSQVEYDSMGPRQLRVLNDKKRCDFYFESINDAEAFYTSPVNIKNMPEGRVDLGTYQISQDMAAGRQSKHITWVAQISIQLAIWIVDKYIDKHLGKRKMSQYTDEEVVISKRDLRAVLYYLFKKLNS